MSDFVARGAPNPHEGQFWWDAYGNEFVVIRIRRDGRITLRHVRWKNDRHVLPADLHASFTLDRPTPRGDTE